MRRQRIALLMCVFLAIYAGLIIRIAACQLIQGPVLARQAANMRSQEVALKEYARGAILDRNQQPLTDSVSTRALYCLLSELQISSPDGETYSSIDLSLEQVSRELARILPGRDAGDIMAALEDGKASGSRLIRIADDLDQKEIESIKEADQRGLMVVPVLKRYRQDGFLVHTLGYVGQGINARGQAGLEKRYEGILAGESPECELVTVNDARGRPIPGLMFKLRNDQNQSGGKVVLTIDRRIQETVEKALGNTEQGAVVVLDIESREVLAIASRPVFNPYDNISRIIALDPRSPLMNRALTRYYPGSIFKVLVAAAALEEGLVKKTDTFYCSGSYDFDSGVSISCLKKEGHGNINFEKAFKASCNTVFIELGLKIGRERLLQYVDAFHFTDETLLGFSEDRDYTYVSIDPGQPALGNASIGQKGVMITPLQAANLIATIADEGLWKEPVLVKQIVKEKGSIQEITPRAGQQVVSKKTAQTVRDLMTLVVSEGSGISAALDEVAVAGKTGTSQTGMYVLQGDEPREILNTWFGGFFPADHPRWAVVVLVENGETGGKSAAPIFKQIARDMLKLGT